jgi:hypothetical protein
MKAHKAAWTCIFVALSIAIADAGEFVGTVDRIVDGYNFVCVTTRNAGTIGFAESTRQKKASTAIIPRAYRA